MDLDYSGRFVVRRQRKHSIIGQFLKKIIISETRFFEGSPCWEWQASKDDSGYGRFLHLGEFYAHRVSHKIFIGDIPTGFEVDHRCRQRDCQSPLHLEAVPLEVTRQRRSESQTQCKFGHDLFGNNLHVGTNGVRTCKACRYRRIVEWRERHPEKAREVSRLSKADWRSKTGNYR